VYLGKIIINTLTLFVVVVVLCVTDVCVARYTCCSSSGCAVCDWCMCC